MDEFIRALMAFNIAAAKNEVVIQEESYGVLNRIFNEKLPPMPANEIAELFNWNQVVRGLVELSIYSIATTKESNTNTDFDIVEVKRNEIYNALSTKQKQLPVLGLGLGVLNSIEHDTLGKIILKVQRIFIKYMVVNNYSTNGEVIPRLLMYLDSYNTIAPILSIALTEMSKILLDKGIEKTDFSTNLLNRLVAEFPDIEELYTYYKCTSVENAIARLRATIEKILAKDNGEEKLALALTTLLSLDGEISSDKFRAYMTSMEAIAEAKA